MKQAEAQVVSFVVGALGSISRNPSASQDALGIPDIMAALLRAVHVLKKVLRLYTASKS